MIKYEDECCSCGLPCLGSSCPNRNVKHYYCDDCGDDSEQLYNFNGEELCISCIEKRLDKVE